METIKAHGLTIKIETDDIPYDPRKEFDNVGTMLCWHRRSELGDEQSSNPEASLLTLMQEREWREHQKSPHDDIPTSHIMAYVEKHYYILPLYLYEHGGMTMSTSPFSCGWDSGQVGWIYAEKKECEYSDPMKGLSDEVKTYDLYLRGEVYYYDIADDSGNILDSCSGFFGYESAKEAALESAQCIAETLATSYSI